MTSEVKEIATLVGDNGQPLSHEEVEHLRRYNWKNIAVDQYNDIGWYLPTEFPRVDEWTPKPWEEIFKHTDKAIILPVAEYYGSDKMDLNYFNISRKRCYNKIEMREHTTKYLNYFIRYFDIDMELVSIYNQIKYVLDFRSDYDKDSFINDLKRYIIDNPSIQFKAHLMNEQNYSIILKSRSGKSIPSLQYNTEHGKILMWMSLLMNMCIPLICHFIFNNNISTVDDMLLEVFDEIIDLTHVSIYSKFSETGMSEVSKSMRNHSSLWDKQNIRGNSGLTHCENSIDNIILNIMPKYTYEKNVVSFNFTAIRKSNGYKITDIKYEFEFTMLSSSRRDEDFNSDMDKFESFLISKDEGLYLQNKVNCEQTMKNLEEQYGPFDEKEIAYYVERLQENGTHVIHWFQKEILFDLFYKYFGDPVSIQGINVIDYVKLIIISKSILKSNNLVMFPYVLSSKIVKAPSKKSLNKRDQLRLESSNTWKMIKERYNNDKIEQQVQEFIAMILSAEYKIIDFEDNTIDGKVMDNITDILMEEAGLFILMIS